MKCIHKGKVVPDFVVRPVMDGEGKIIGLNLDKGFDYSSRSFLRFCMSERDINSAALKEFFDRTVMLMNMWWTGTRWEAGRFTADQYKDLVRRAEAKGFVAQYGKAKWPTGGGRNAGSAGKFFWAKENVTDDLFKKYLSVDPDKLSSREKVARSAILFTPVGSLTKPPVISYIDTTMNGIVWVSPDYAVQEGLCRGDKLTPIKASVEIAPFDMKGADILVPMDSVKFQEHKDPVVLDKLVAPVPGLSSKERSSQQKDRLPRLALDVMQWFHPELQGYLDQDGRMHRGLERVRRVIEGKATLEEVLEMGKYKDPATGEDKYPMEFNFLKRGQPLHQTEIRSAVFKAAGTALRSAICFRVGGAYGVAMPTAEHKTRPADVIVPPWMLPITTECDSESSDVVGVDTSMLVDCLGKDYDGDLSIVLDTRWFKKALGIKGALFPDWTRKEVCARTVKIGTGEEVVCGRCSGTGVWYPDREWCMAHMNLPEKAKVEDGRSVHDVMVDGLKSYGLIGVATNICMIVLDTLRVSGMDRRKLMGLYLKMMSTEVQLFVDALKYNPKGFSRPKLETIAAKYGANPKLALKVRDYFRAVRNMDIDALVTLPEDPEMKGSFYYAVASLFRGWKPLPAIDMQTLGAEMVKAHPLPETLEKARRSSFVRFRGNADAIKERYCSLEHMLSDESLHMALIARCWERKDTSLALMAEERCGKRLVSVAGEETLAKARAPKFQFNGNGK